MGTTTRAYKVFQENFAGLVTAVTSDVEGVARSSLGKNLISKNNKAAAENPYHNADSRASTLLGQIHNKIEEKADNFEVFMTILYNMPNLRAKAVELMNAGMSLSVCRVCSMI